MLETEVGMGKSWVAGEWRWHGICDEDGDVIETLEVMEAGGGGERAGGDKGRGCSWWQE